MPDEPLVLVGGIGGANRVDKQAVEIGGAHPVEDDLVHVAQAAVAEVVVSVGLEVLVGQRAVRGQLLGVAEVFAVGDREVTAGVEVQRRSPAGDGAERALGARCGLPGSQTIRAVPS